MGGSPLTGRRDPPSSRVKRETSIDEATVVGHQAFSPSTWRPEDAAELAALRAAVCDHLTSLYGAHILGREPIMEDGHV